MSERLALPVSRVHVLIDLQVTVLEEILDLPPEERAALADEFESERQMAARSGLPLEWITGFCRIWDQISGDVDRENLAMRTGDYLGIPRTT